MNIVYLLLPVALIIVGIIIFVFMWAVRSDQFDDLEGPAYKVLLDDDENKKPNKKPDSQKPGARNDTPDAPATPPQDKT